jgi:Tol biopolymer transport system component
LARKAIEYLRDEYEAFVGRFSPDGRLLAFVSNESERNQLWVRGFDAASGMPTAEGKWRVSTDGADAVMGWRADGQELYYMHNDIDTGDTLFMAVELSKSPSFQPGTPKLMFRIPSTPQGNAGVWKNVTRDGRQFVFTLPITSSSR